MNTEHELFGELHEQEEYGLFGNEHRRQYEAQQEALRLSDVIHCCEINCKDKAVFHLQDIGEGKTYEDYTYCCEKHLAEMIGDNTLYEVWRLKQ